MKASLTLAEGGQITVIDESYNASPASVRATIRVLTNMTPAAGGRRVLVLGDMLELGVTASTLHSDLAAAIIQGKIDSVFCCGVMMRYLYDSLPPALRGAHAEDSATLAPLVAQDIHANDVVSVKGSKSMKLGKVIDALHALTSTSSQKIAS